MTGRVFAPDLAGQALGAVVAGMQRDQSRHIQCGEYAAADYLPDMDAVLRFADRVDGKLAWLAVIALAEAGGGRAPFMPIVHDLLITADGGLCTLEELLDPIPDDGPFEQIVYQQQVSDLVPQARPALSIAYETILDTLERYDIMDGLDYGIDNLMIRRAGQRTNFVLTMGEEDWPLAARAPQAGDELVLIDPISGYYDAARDTALLHAAAPVMRMLWPGFAASERHLPQPAVAGIVPGV